MSIDDNKTLINRFLDLHEPDTHKQQFDLMREDCVFVLPFGDVRLDGRAAILKLAAGSRMPNWKRGTFVDRTIYETARSGVYALEATGDMILPNGAEYRNRYIFFFEIIDGKFKEIREYFDPALAREKFAEPPVG